MLKNAGNLSIALPTITCIVTFGVLQMVMGHDVFYKGMALSLFGSFIYLICFIALRKYKTESRLITILMILNAVIVIFASCISYYFFKGDIVYSSYDDVTSSLTISVAVVHAIIAFLSLFVLGHSVGRKRLYRHDSNGDLYVQDAGHLTKITPDKIANYPDYAVMNFTSDTNANVDLGYGHTEHVGGLSGSSPSFDTNTYVNPTTGAPMVGGMGGIDTTGHTWGQ